jgi:hypothetical protein
LVIQGGAADLNQPYIVGTRIEAHLAQPGGIELGRRSGCRVGCCLLIERLDRGMIRQLHVAYRDVESKMGR